jgi:hypothetical protein
MKQTSRWRNKTAKKGKEKKRRRESSPQSLKLINHSSVSQSTARQLIRCGLLTFKSFSDRLNKKKIEESISKNKMNTRKNEEKKT